MKNLILIVSVLFALNVNADGWMFVQVKSTHQYSWIDSTEYNAATMTNLTTVEGITTVMQYSLDKDHVFVRSRIKEIVASKGFASLTDYEKDQVGMYCATDMNTLIGYYMGKGMTQLEATSYYLDMRMQDVEWAADAYCARINNPDFQKYILMFLGEDQGISLNDAIRNFKSDLCEVALLGTGYGDNRDGIMDYFESTGSYTSGGLKSYTMSDMVVSMYGSQEAARTALIEIIQNILVKGI